MSYQPPQQYSYPPASPTYPPTGAAPPAPPAPGPGPFPGGFSLEGAKQQVVGAIRARQTTDEIVSSIWVIVPVLFIIVSLAIGLTAVFWMFSSLGSGVVDPFNILNTGSAWIALVIVSFAISILFYVLIGILSYKLVKRQNEHCQREAQLRMGMISFLKAAAGSPEREATIASEIATMNTIHSQSNMSERQREPVLWALAIILGFLFIPFIGVILGLYMFYFLMKTIYEHDSRWNTFAQQTQLAMNKLGYAIGAPPWIQAVPNRSFVVYLILSIITLGLFALYWLHTLVKDPNEHFKSQWYFEDQLVNSIGR